CSTTLVPFTLSSIISNYVHAMLTGSEQLCRATTGESLQASLLRLGSFSLLAQKISPPPRPPMCPHRLRPSRHSRLQTKQPRKQAPLPIKDHTKQNLSFHP